MATLLKHNPRKLVRVQGSTQSILPVVVTMQRKDTEDKDDKIEESKILCQQCKRTATNNIRCLGMCVADSDY